MTPNRTTLGTQPVKEPAKTTSSTDDAKKAKEAEKLARLHRIEAAANDLKSVWLGSAFYDRQAQSLAEALIDALDS